MLKVTTEGKYFKKYKVEKSEMRKSLEEGKKPPKQKPPSTFDPLTHRRGWSKVREEAGEKAGVLCVLLEEGNKHGGENLCGCTCHNFDQEETVFNYKVTFSPTDPGRPSSPLSPWW